MRYFWVGNTAVSQHVWFSIDAFQFALFGILLPATRNDVEHLYHAIIFGLANYDSKSISRWNAQATVWIPTFYCVVLAQTVAQGATYKLLYSRCVHSFSWAKLCFMRTATQSLLGLQIVSFQCYGCGSRSRSFLQHTIDRVLVPIKRFISARTRNAASYEMKSKPVRSTTAGPNAQSLAVWPEPSIFIKQLKRLAAGYTLLQPT